MITFSKLFAGESSLQAASDFAELAFNASENAINDPALKRLLGDSGTRFDVLLTTVAPASEIGYFLAHRFSAQLVLYCTAQASVPHMDYAVGMPHNPAYIPFAVTGYNRDMNFFQRMVNTAVTNFVLFMRYG